MPAGLRRVLVPRTALFAAWALLAVTDLFSDALADTRPGFRDTVSVGLWSLWAATLVLVVLPGPVPLTAVRVVTSAGVAATGWALATVDEPGPSDLATIVLTALAAIIAFLPATGEAFVDAASYGDERRMLLRVPLAIAAGPAPGAWAVVVAGTTSGPLLLADQRWVPGAIAIAAGLPLALVALRALVRLARRWLVFVPAGVVLHDPSVLVDPVLFERRTIASMGPARHDTDAVDLSAQATGLALEVGLRRPAELVLRAGRSDTRKVAVDRFLVAATRPGAVLREAAARRITIA